MGKLEISGTIRTLETTERRKKDLETEKGKIVIMNEDGDRVDIKGADSIINGFAPEEQVTVTISRTNKTLKEAIESKKEEEKGE